MGLSSKERYYLKVKAAYLCYLQDMTQVEAAQSLGISRPTLSKLLKEAKEEGIVRIQIQDFRRVDKLVELEAQLMERLQLRDVRVAGAASGEEAQVLGRIGEVAAEYFSQTVKNGMKIGLSWGKTLDAVSHFLSPDPKVKGLEFIPLLGGPSQSAAGYRFVNSIGERFASNYPDSNITYIHAPLLAPSREAADAYYAMEPLQSAWAQLDRLDMALLGVDGDPLHSTSLTAEKVRGNLAAELVEKGVVGNVCTRFYDIQGRCCSGLDDRVLAIRPEVLKKIPLRIGVAGGKWKVKSIIGAARGGFYNVLITDETTAKALLELLDAA